MEQPKITPRMWQDWQSSSATEAVRSYIEAQKSALIEQLLGLPLSETAEQTGLAFIAIRYKLDGLGEFLDFENIGENIVLPEGN